MSNNQKELNDRLKKIEDRFIQIESIRIIFQQVTGCICTKNKSALNKRQIYSSYFYAGNYLIEISSPVFVFSVNFN